MVEPFSEVGMIAQVSAIQPVMDQPSRASCDPLMLPDHLQSMLDLTSKGLDSVQRGQLANTLLQFVDLFPVSGSALTGVARDFTPSKYCIRGVVFSRPLAKYCTGVQYFASRLRNIVSPLNNQYLTRLIALG